MNEINVKEAQKILWEHHAEISTAKDWADYMNCSEDTFATKMNEETGSSPEKILQRSKFKKLDEVILNNPEISAVTLAKEIGLSGIQELYDFIKANRGYSIREYKNKVLRKKK
ncbi:MAG TPA: hypothetical protein VFG39_09075 [Balneolaceae bacterium]|nr:hypothetical protein [Balneolaceae bacterium]